jgi:MFS family permease
MPESMDDVRQDSKLPHSFRALRSRNYRIFYFSQGFSLIGTWMQQVALGWLSYRMTRSTVLLGWVGFATAMPAVPLSPLAGVWVDRWDRRRLLLTTQALSLLQATVLAALVLTGRITVVEIVALSALLGVVNAFDVPGRQTFVMELLDDPQDLPNAIALNSTMFNAARLVGPAVAGLLIAGFGEGVCFSFNALSFAAPLAALLFVHPTLRGERRVRTHWWKELREGVAYVWTLLPLRSVLLQLFLVGLAATPMAVLMPVFAKDVLRGGAHTQGFLMSASGVGALAGGLFLVTRRETPPLRGLLTWAGILLGAGMALFGASRWFPLSLALAVAMGFCMIVQITVANTMVQSMATHERRGRIMGLYAMALIGSAPFGSLLGGVLARLLGAPETLAVCGACCVGAVALVARVRHD